MGSLINIKDISLASKDISLASNLASDSQMCCDDSQMATQPGVLCGEFSNIRVIYKGAAQ